LQVREVGGNRSRDNSVGGSDIHDRFTRLISRRQMSAVIVVGRSICQRRHAGLRVPRGPKAPT
jgi:hypothetical protein